MPDENNQPLPVCDYTGDADAPCEEPALVRRWSSASVFVASLIGALVGGMIVAAVLVWALGLVGSGTPLIKTTGTTKGANASRSAAGSLTIQASDNVNAAEAVAEKGTPSVVNVTIKQTLRNPFTGQTVTQDAGVGSGVIIRSDGYILTNNHVISNADSIYVSVGVENLKATVVGADPTTDLAVIKIAKTGLPAAEIGSSSDLKVGQFVVAIGSPFGLQKTVTSGIISALQRTGEASDGTSRFAATYTTYTNLIQTDAAINPGNSGGALFDEQGTLIGINTLIQSTSGSSAGIGFAIPIDQAMDIAQQLIDTGRATHPFMGVSTETIDENTAAVYGLSVKAGALVRLVQPSGPADKAGVKAGDIITRMGDAEIASVTDVFAALRSHKIGDTVDVVVVRADAEYTLKVTLGSDAVGASS
jgi:putative serine protease PepD